MKKTLLLLCAVVISLMLVQPGLADDPNAYVGLPVSQTAEGTGAEDLEVSYILTPETSGAPMPAGTENGSYCFHVQGTKELTMPVIHCTENGTWSYTLRPVEIRNASVTPESVSVILRYPKYGSPQVAAYLSSGEKCELSFVIRGEMSSAATPKQSPASKGTASDSAKKTTPKTGDEYPLTEYGAAFLFSTLMLTLLWRKSRRDTEGKLRGE